MVILNMLSLVNSVSSSAPNSNESPSSPPPDYRHPRQTKIILPKKKPQKWSTGVNPGDYGGPPTTTKLRKYWGGEGEDPLTSNEYIWNKDFMGRMKRFVQDPDVSSSSSPQSNRVKEAPSGFLSLNRAMSLDSLEIDLSKELKAPLKTVVEQHVEAEPQNIDNTSPKWKLAPTRREQDKWDRASKAATGGTDVMLREVRRPREDPEVLAAQSREQYYKLKNKLQVLTVGIGGFGLVSSCVTYTPEIAASFGVGFLGSLVYIRMLGSTVDSMADGARGLIKGATGQPRLLVPVVLVMVYNRWNGILVPDYGIMNLQLIPMLVGFFTYKIATFIQAIEEAISIVDNKTDT